MVQAFLKYPAWGKLGEASGRAGDLEGATAALRRALELAPGHPAASALLERLERQRLRGSSGDG